MDQVAHEKMFTFRSSSYQLIQYLLIFFVSSGVIAKEGPLKCAAFNEYCLNHWDCCSNVCLSYLYRCSRGHGSYPYPFLGISYKPTVTLDDIYEQNFGSPNDASKFQYQAHPYFANRLGSVEDFPATEVLIVLQKSEDGKKDTPDLKNPTQLKENPLKVENDLDETTKNTKDLEETSAATKNFLGDEGTETHTDRGFATTQGAVKRSTENPSCAQIGEKCYGHEDCCDRLCHDYLHKCVT